MKSSSNSFVQMQTKIYSSILLISIFFVMGWTIDQVPLMAQGEKTFLTHADEALDLIAEAAVERQITGVAAIAFISGDVSLGWTSKMKVVSRLATDKVNLASIAYSKISEMAVTLQDSGQEERKDIRGEYGYQGGIILKVPSGYLLASFSGGSGQEDYDAAKIGIQKLATYF